MLLKHRSVGLIARSNRPRLGQRVCSSFLNGIGSIRHEGSTSEPQPRGPVFRRVAVDPPSGFIKKASRPEQKQDEAVNGSFDFDLDLSPAKAASSSRCVGRGIILTGGTGGIGLAVAKRLVQEGAGRIVLITRSSQRGHESVRKIKEQTSLHDAPISVFTADLATDFSPINALLRRFRHCNTLINCAGIKQSRPILSSAILESYQIINTNLLAPVALSKYFLKKYHRSRKTQAENLQAEPSPSSIQTQNFSQSYCLINTSSLLAHRAVVGTADYAASKAGLIAHTRTVALEASRYHQMPGGRVPFRANVILPGYVDTSMLDFSDEMRTRIIDGIPLKRYGTPEEVADAIIFLITNEYANNCVLNLDGGLSAT